MQEKSAEEIRVQENVQEKQAQLLEWLRAAGRVAVAFSAGVDSTVLAKAAQLALGDNALGVIANSPSLPLGTLEEARQLANEIGIPLHVLETTEFERQEYQANAGNRCYFCKDTLYQAIDQIKATYAVETVVNGTNTDDLGDFRPGLQAAAEHQVRSPFVEVGISKADIRQLAREWNLPVWDKPASPCLSSRIAHGLEVTIERVRRVDAAERYLKELLGIQELRVRHEFHDLARIEVPTAQLPRLTEPDISQAVVAQFTSLGFRYVTIDLAGFRSGSLNQVLPLEILSR